MGGGGGGGGGLSGINTDTSVGITFWLKKISEHTGKSCASCLRSLGAQAMRGYVRNFLTSDSKV